MIARAMDLAGSEHEPHGVVEDPRWAAEKLKPILEKRDENGFELVLKRVVWRLDICHTDGEGKPTRDLIASFRYRSRERAFLERDLTIARGELIKTPWGECRAAGNAYSYVMIYQKEERVDD
jgi:hypothetical protein